MKLLSPTPPPYDPLAWAAEDFEPRARQVCQAWALQGYGAPLAVHAAYALKVVGYVLAWVFFCRFTPGLGGLTDFFDWWLHPVAFQKAVVFSLLFEVLGLGCGSGPLTGRYLPPLGGFLYFLRPGTTKLPLFPQVPVIGRDTRGLLDVALYAALVAVLLRALVAPTPGVSEFLPIALLVPALGVLDKTVFLAARAEHY